MSSADPTPRTAVVTVTYGSDDVLPGFLRSVRDSSSQRPLVVVADNKPDDGITRSLAEAEGALYLAMTDNRGYGGAVNSAVEQLPASVEWILVSNPDVVLGPGSLDSLTARGDADPSIGSVGPAVLTPEGDVYPSARAVPSIRTGIGHALFANLWPTNPWTRAYRREDTRFDVRDAGWLSGACLLVRREAFDRLHGFDTGYFMYFEDVDLGMRLGEAGYRNVFDPTASVQHSGAHSTTRESANMVRAHHASAKRFLQRKYPGPLLWPTRIVLSAGLSIRSWLSTRRGR
ncbi:glycosyltransferase family 2 protein [Leifsonia sp. TF02-11]|uniref:glycosyltransferase family 2 protein n=1 Tax=Leifsonia sp. TF02-11 TaxID=2815212 RepID=UPI001AA187FB|nr:glycosyltransferase family 2 protein [Leifsonia sp. TF02-11]MBO1737401.1 glycosyltransferase family 2 protein [Leifsonia sp. TF02-11]